MSIMNVQYGFDLSSTKHYAKPETAARAPEKALSLLIERGLVFNVLVVSQRKGGMGTDAEDLRYIPILHNFRLGQDATLAGGDTQGAIYAARSGFHVFA